MKTKLLKRVRVWGWNAVHIYSVTRNGWGTVTGMKYGYNRTDLFDDVSLFTYGDEPDDVRRMAQRIFMEDYVKKEREKRAARAKK